MLTFGESTLGVGVSCHRGRDLRAGSGTVCTIWDFLWKLYPAGPLSPQPVLRRPCLLSP